MSRNVHQAGWCCKQSESVSDVFQKTLKKHYTVHITVTGVCSQSSNYCISGFMN